MVDSEKIREQLPAIFLKLCEVEVYRSGESFHRVFEKKDGDISTTPATATATVAVTDSGGEGGEADTSESNNTINEAPQSIDIFFWAHVPASFRLLALQDKSIGTQHISATSSHHFIIQTRKEKILNIPIHPESARRRMSRTTPRGPVRRRYVLCQQVDSVEEWQTALQVLEYGCLLAMSKTEAKDVLEVVSFVCLVSAHPYAETELYEHIFSSSTLPEVQRLVQAGGFLFLYHDGSSDAFESVRSTEELSVMDKGGELNKTTSKEESTNDQEGTEQPGSTALSTEEGEVKQEKKRKNPGQKARARAKALALVKEKPVVAPPQVVASTANTVLVSTQSHFPDKALQNKVVELSTAVGNMRKDIQAVRKQMVNLENVVKHLCQAVEKLLPAAQQDSSLAPADLVSTVPSEEEVGTEEIVVKEGEEEEEEEEEAKEEEMAVSSSSVVQEEVVAQVEPGTDVPSTD